MRIAAADIGLSSDQRFAAVRLASERLGIRAPGPLAAAPPPASDHYQPYQRQHASESGAYSRADLTAGRAAAAGDRALAGEPQQRDRIVRDLLQGVFGMQDISSYDLTLSSEHSSLVQQSEQLSAQSAQGPAGWGVAYDYSAEYHEMESLRFAAEGTVTTADGQSFAISFSYEMEREYHQSTTVSLRAGGGAGVDPQTLDLDAAFGFDRALPNFAPAADGGLPDLPRLTGGAAFPGVDRNDDARIGAGRGRFGALSGDAFARPAALDGASNGRLDASDLAWQALLHFDRGGAFMRLAEARIAALADLRAAGRSLSDAGLAGDRSQLDLIG